MRGDMLEEPVGIESEGLPQLPGNSPSVADFLRDDVQAADTNRGREDMSVAIDDLPWSRRNDFPEDPLPRRQPFEIGPAGQMKLHQAPRQQQAQQQDARSNQPLARKVSSRQGICE